MKLIIEEETYRPAYVESTFKSRLKTALKYDETIWTFFISAKSIMSQVRTNNHIKIWQLYTVEFEQNKVWIWHLNIKGEKDRLVMRVAEKPIN
ncbi:hypothetical protein [Bacteroides sp. UBA939]|uniref:hypothetical protein n=1 Tax=Bacteroides sp. UBA939 TaxID=1946092 RepID=UPI0025C2E674|nr:hypothetical protein [Bacteroides sp. UBA939]